MINRACVYVEEFENNYRGAKGYHHRALQFLETGQSNSVVFNVACVALENYLIALCLLHGIEPANHNYICLMNAVESIVAVPSALNTAIRSLDESVFGICSLDNYYHGDPNQVDSAAVLKMCDEINSLFDQTRVIYVLTTLHKAI